MRLQAGCIHATKLFLTKKTKRKKTKKNKKQNGMGDVAHRINSRSERTKEREKENPHSKFIVNYLRLKFLGN